MSKKRRLGSIPLEEKKKIRKSTSLQVNKSTNKQVDKLSSKPVNKYISQVGNRLTFYIKPNLESELRHLAVEIKNKGISDLINDGIELIIKKYKRW